jgi:MSHA biogenesis protein MshO
MNNRSRRMRAHSAGFTLIEMVVAITISAVVVVFAAMFLSAPVDAYEAHNRRSLLVADASTAWPRIQADLRAALPNSVRARRNGNYVALEMLDTIGHARYSTPAGATFTVAGTANGVFGAYAAGTDFNFVHLAVNNAGQEAYTQTTSMTPRLALVDTEPNGVAGEATVQLAAPPGINWNSPRNRVYLVRAPITYLCDEAQGTLRRYAGYAVAALQTARDTPAELAGAPAQEVVARGLTRCEFDAPLLAGRPQNVALRLTSTRNNESVTLLHTTAVVNLP